MLFNSIQYAIFLPIVFLLHWFLANRNVTSQNVLLLIASYFFYSCWDWRFLFLLVFSTLLDYFTGIKIGNSKTKKTRKVWLWLSIGINVGFLGVFKYYNFFQESFAHLLENFGMQANFITLNVILPVGISFYTFHGISYVLDIYNDKIKPERNFVVYSLFVGFFPLLVAGPIERATHLLPQLKEKRVFNYTKSVDGLKQILWGLFKKVVIADNCAEYANLIFDNYAAQPAAVLLLGALFFSFQIYGDFSGYSDIALGTAKLFGVDLLRNFSYPYFSRDIAEFWRRWHMSLTTWFRDYLYIPLGGSKSGKIRNTFIIFIVSGFWHGANWTFVFWGLLNAIYFIPLLITGKNRSNLNVVAEFSHLPNFKELFQMLFTFSITVIAWIFFRSTSISDAFAYLSGFRRNPGSFLLWSVYSPYAYLFVLIAFMLLLEWNSRRNRHALEYFGIKLPAFVRHSFYYLIVLVIFYFQGTSQNFIYFQF
jgi:alginate O-acetyltransferase complex protein AlgI